MKKILYGLAIILPLLSFQCSRNEPKYGELKLRIVPKYGQDALVMYQNVVSAQGFSMQFQRVSLFLQVQDGGAIAKNGEADFVFIDLSNLTDLAKATQGISSSFDLEVGNYNALNLGIGVPKSLNKKQPSDFSSKSPLSETGEYWKSWDSYIFTKTEGVMDTTKTGKGDLPFSYHTGIDEMFRTINFPASFTINENQSTELVLELDVKELLNGKAGVINPLKNQNSHSLSNKSIAITLSDNYKTALKIK
ncbi:MAG: MbnP family protein [Bacteroidia bacterium]